MTLNLNLTNTDTQSSFGSTQGNQEYVKSFFVPDSASLEESKRKGIAIDFIRVSLIAAGSYLANPNAGHAPLRTVIGASLIVGACELSNLLIGRMVLAPTLTILTNIISGVAKRNASFREVAKEIDPETVNSADFKQEMTGEKWQEVLAANLDNQIHGPSIKIALDEYKKRSDKAIKVATPVAVLAGTILQLATAYYAFRPIMKFVGVNPARTALSAPVSQSPASRPAL